MFKIFYELSMLAAEAQQAIWLRTIRLSAGGSAAGREAQLMVTEKLAAAQQAFSSLAAGAPPIGIVRAYRSKVRLNVRRLSRR
ncbi:hypothetical protein [Bosea sp. 2YAB26]|uniref:hypothetical protein n=1 Tax=Bosea sp. 2YAB26 TaxID=3237478 RepID=UPI003F906CB2